MHSSSNNEDSLTPGKIVKDYIIKEKIGDGSYGEVYKVTKQSDPNGPQLVLKEIQLKKCENKSQLEMVKNEAPILSKLKSEYVVQYYDSFEENNNVYIIMEYCEGGDLSHYLADYKKSNNIKMLSEDSIWKWFIQISLGLLHIHSNKILHRDLKSLNIFLTKNLNVKIGDLGVAKILKNASHAMTIIGTPYYLSPEICEEKPYNEKSDVWSLGCILYEMIMFKHPFNAASTPALFIKILNGKFDPLPAGCPSDLKKMIEMLLEKNYYKRLSMKEIIQHQSFQAKAKKLDLIGQVNEYMMPVRDKIRIIKVNQVRLNKRAKFQSINNVKSVNKLSPFEVSAPKKHYGSDLKDIKVSNSEKKLNLSSNKNKGGGGNKNRNPSTEKNFNHNSINCNSNNFNSNSNSNNNNKKSPNKLKSNQNSLNNVIRFSSVRNSNNNNSVSKDKQILNTSNNSNGSGDEIPPMINVTDFLNELSKKSSNAKYDISCFTNEDLTKQTPNTTAITSNKLTVIPTEGEVTSAYKESDTTFLPQNCINGDDTDEANDVDEFFAESEAQEGDGDNNTRDLSKENIEEMKEKYKAKYNKLYEEFKAYNGNLDCDVIFAMYKEIEDNKSTVDEGTKKIEDYIRKQIPLKTMEFIELFYNLIYYEQQYKNIVEKASEGR